MGDLWGVWGPHFVPYQVEFLLDDSRFTGMVKSRRIGGSRALAAKATGGAIGYQYSTGVYSPKAGVNEYLISASQDQSEMLLREALDVARQFERCMGAYARALGVLAKAGRQYSYDDLDYAACRYLEAGHEFTGHLIADHKNDEISFVNGRSIYARPANPDTARGFTGNLRFDEFGSMPRSHELWRAAKPIMDKNLRRYGGYALSITGTPLGDDNMFYELACTEAGARFNWHWVDIYRAVADGFPAIPDELRAEAGDDDMYSQEYCTVFLSANSRYIPAELIDSPACMYVANSRHHQEAMQASQANGREYGGLDVAISERGDNSAYVQVRKVGAGYWVKPDDLWSERGASFKTQRGVVGNALANGARRVCFDATGIGSNMAEDLVDQYGSAVEPVTFTLDVKEDLVTRMKRLLVEGRVRIPTSATQLRRDLLALRRIVTSAGNVRFDVKRSRPGRKAEPGGAAGHGDSAWALALALHAAEAGPANPGPKWLGYGGGGAATT